MRGPLLRLGREETKPEEKEILEQEEPDNLDDEPTRPMIRIDGLQELLLNL